MQRLLLAAYIYTCVGEGGIHCCQSLPNAIILNGKRARNGELRANCHVYEGGSGTFLDSGGSGARLSRLVPKCTRLCLGKEKKCEIAAWRRCVWNAASSFSVGPPLLHRCGWIPGRTMWLPCGWKAERPLVTGEPMRRKRGLFELWQHLKFSCKGHMASTQHTCWQCWFFFHGKHLTVGSSTSVALQLQWNP